MSYTNYTEVILGVVIEINPEMSEALIKLHHMEGLD